MAVNDKAIVELTNGTLSNTNWNDRYLPFHLQGDTDALKVSLKKLAEFFASVSQIGIGNFRGDYDSAKADYRTGDYVRDPSDGKFYLYVDSSNNQTAALSNNQTWGLLHPQGGGGGGGGGSAWNWRGQFQGFLQYVANDVVEHQGSSWICIVTPNNGVAPGTNPGIWNLVAAAGAPGNNGTDGTNGTNGTDGTNGTNGTNGVGIQSANVDGDGNLTLTLTDSTVLGPWNVKGPQGENGPPGPNVLDSNTTVNFGNGFLIADDGVLSLQQFGDDGAHTVFNGTDNQTWQLDRGLVQQVV